MRALRLVLVFVCLAAGQEPVALRAPGHAGTPMPVAVSRVSISSPFPSACNGAQTGTNYRNGPVEPFVAVDPTNPDHLIGVWQQDRWSNGGSSGLMTGVTMDRGRTWTTSFAHFSACSGGIYDRASDPWVSISPDGTAYQIALGLKDNNLTIAVLVSRSSDGGSTWGEPATLILDPSTSPAGSDKESITADPNDARYVYAVWDKTSGNSSTLWFSRTTDGGATWEPSRMIFNPGTNGFAGSNQIVVLPDGTLVDLTTTGRGTINVAVMRSTDHGVSWAGPTVVSSDETIGTVDVRTQIGIRNGAGIPAIAVDRASGAIYIVWTDSRFSGHLRDGIALSRSTDGGVTWSAPVQVNQAPNVQAFTPAVAVGAGGVVVVTYYDFRKAVSTPGPLWTNYWRITSVDGGVSWRESPLAGPFDLLSAPMTGVQVPFLGDYQGLAASGDVFLAFFAAANSGNALNPSDIFASTLERGGDTSSNQRTEFNLRPQPMKMEGRPIPRKK